jgi:hypothetical protein
VVRLNLNAVQEQCGRGAASQGYSRAVWERCCISTLFYSNVRKVLHLSAVLEHFGSEVAPYPSSGFVVELERPDSYGEEQRGKKKSDTVGESGPVLNRGPVYRTVSRCQLHGCGCWGRQGRWLQKLHQDQD